MTLMTMAASESPRARSVFLSYARGDDEAFVARLYADLVRAGFDVWWDRERMPSRGAVFLAEIRQAIDECERFLLVAGPGAWSSAYVVAEWQHALTVGKPITPVLRLGDYESTPSELRLLHAEDARDDRNYEICLRRIVRQLSTPVPRLGKLIGVPRLPRHLLARPAAVAALRDIVLVDLLQPTTVDTARAVTGVAGMGGIGKSVLANLLARDLDTRRAFPDGIVWVPVGSAPDLTALQRQIASVWSANPVTPATVGEGKARLSEVSRDKRVLLVLDDVWEREHAEAFDVLGPRGRAVVTTRNAGVVRSIGGEQFQVPLPTESESLQILSRGAGSTEDAMPPLAQEVARESGRLPLALALCGGMVKRGYAWSDVLERLRSAALEHVGDRDAATPHHRSVWAVIEVSVAALTPTERRRFHDLGVFEHAGGVPARAVRTLWSRTREMSEYACEDLLHALADRSLLQLEERFDEVEGSRGARVRLHDLLIDYLSRVAPADVATHRRLLDAYGTQCRDGWASGPDDGYFYQRLFHHLVSAERIKDVGELLFDARWLAAKLRLVPARGLDADCRLLLTHRSTPLKGQSKEFVEFLREFVAPLEAPELLPTVLWGHFAGTRNRRIARVLRQVESISDRTWLKPLSPSLSVARAGPIRVIGGAGSIESIAIGDTEAGEPIIAKVGRVPTAEHQVDVWLGEVRQRSAPIPEGHVVTALNTIEDYRPALLHTWERSKDDRCCRLYDLTAAGDAVGLHLIAMMDLRDAPLPPVLTPYALGAVMSVGAGRPRCIGRLGGRLSLLVSLPASPPSLRRPNGVPLTYPDLINKVSHERKCEFMQLLVEGMKEEGLTSAYAGRITKYAKTVSASLGEEIVVDPAVAVPHRAAVWDVETGKQRPELVCPIPEPPFSEAHGPVLLGESSDGSPFIVLTTLGGKASLQRLDGRTTTLSTIMHGDRPILSRYRGRPAILKGGLDGIDVVDATNGEPVGRFTRHLDNEKLLASIEYDGRRSLAASTGSLGSRGRFSTSVRLWDVDAQKQVFPTGDIHTEEIEAITSGLYRGEPVFATGSWNVICVWRAQALRGYSSHSEPTRIPDPNLCGRIALGDLPRGYRHHDLGSVLPQLLMSGMVVGVSTRAASRSDEESLIASRQVWRLASADSGGWRHGVVDEAVETGRGSDVIAVSMKGEGKRSAVIETMRRDGTTREWVLMPRADEERQFVNWLYWHCVAIRGPLVLDVQVDIRVDPMSGDVSIAYEHNGRQETLSFDSGVPATQCALGEKRDTIVIFDERGNTHHLALVLPSQRSAGRGESAPRHP